jgi:hypothetical protein
LKRLRHQPPRMKTKWQWFSLIYSRK